MWGPLLENFPDLAALGRLMYGSTPSIIFNESGYGRSEVFSSVGSRQGCSWGSFLYCLTIHPLLKQLVDEFLGCAILAFADDVNIIGPPELAAAAYKRWRFLYAALLQGELKDSKSKCYSPKISAEAVRAAGMPTDVEIATDGTRVLGGPVGSPDYCRSFAENLVQESSRRRSTERGTFHITVLIFPVRREYDHRDAFGDAQGVSEGVNSGSRLAHFDRRIGVFTLCLR